MLAERADLTNEPDADSSVACFTVELELTTSEIITEVFALTSQALGICLRATWSS